MSDLILNQHELQQLHADLQNVIRSFESIDGISQSVADQVGHHGELPSRVREFAAGWDDRRKNISESLAIVEKVYTEIFKSFDDVDSKMASVLHGGSKSTSTPVGKKA